MRTYTYQIGEGTGDAMGTPVHAEPLFADSLGEAIDKARAITEQRPPHARETLVRLVQSADDAYPLWTSPAEDVRDA